VRSPWHQGRAAVKRALAVIGAVTISAALLPLAARVAWVFELFTHFRVQLIAALAVLIVIFALRRAYRWCAALGVSAAINVMPLIPYLPLGGASGTDAPTLSLMAVNVQYNNSEHAGLLASIAETDPDVVVVVELTARWEEHLASLAAKYPYQIRYPQADAFGVALYSRHPLETASELVLASTVAIDARIVTPRGNLRVIGVHLRPPKSRALAHERNMQLTALATHVAAIDEPLAVLGDFNISPYSPYFTDWVTATGLHDARQGQGLGFTWPTFLPLLGVPIDHCLVRDGLTVAQYARLPAFGSDHYPVIARLAQE
jgi:endonuclease/exonuclease/phosphatase (EEP) superfamily protein YafD